MHVYTLKYILCKCGGKLVSTSGRCWLLVWQCVGSSVSVRPNLTSWISWSCVKAIGFHEVIGSFTNFYGVLRILITVSCICITCEKANKHLRVLYFCWTLPAYRCGKNTHTHISWEQLQWKPQPAPCAAGRDEDLQWNAVKWIRTKWHLRRLGFDYVNQLDSNTV